MCTRSVQRVMQLDTWRNAVWRSWFRQIRIEHWPLFLWLGWHYSLKFCLSISSLISYLLSHSPVISKRKSHMLAVLPPDLDSRPFAWCVRSFHMHRLLIMSHNLGTEIKQKLTLSKIDIQIAFQRNMMSKIQICLFIPPLTHEPSPCIRPNLISISWLVGKGICRGKSFRVQKSLHCEWVINPVPWWGQDRVYSCLTAQSQNLASYDYVLHKKSRVAFPIFLGQCQHTP